MYYEFVFLQYLSVLPICFAQSDENLNFYFMKTANIPVYGIIAVYIHYYTVCLN